MKKLLLATLFLASAALVHAADGKFEGTATCAKCDLKTEEKCRAALIITVDGTRQTFLAEVNDKAKQLHSEICEKAKPVKVEGEVVEKDGKKTFKITKFIVKD
jgi:hypothetical protein